MPEHSRPAGTGKLNKKSTVPSEPGALREYTPGALALMTIAASMDGEEPLQGRERLIDPVG